ncbi:MAG: FtsQ-type POTRA domain-containing protein [Firmicutes bacterium]|nr:FtsQ-type POTRA domain-containing protein [Bacillota bacterium]
MDEKPKKKRKRRKSYFIVQLIILIVLIVLGCRFLLSDYFLIQDIGVTGNAHHSQDAVIELAEDPRGQNLFKVKTRDLEVLLEQDPYIEDALVTRSLPDTLAIKVKERTEYAAVVCTGGYILMDQECRVLQAVAYKPDLPLLEGVNVTSSQPGTILEVSEKWMLEDTMSMLRSMEESDLYFRRLVISPVSVHAYIYDDLFCQGTPGNILEHMDELQKVVYDLYEKDVRHGVVTVGDDGYFSFNPDPNMTGPKLPVEEEPSAEDPEASKEPADEE